MTTHVSPGSSLAVIPGPLRRPAAAVAIVGGAALIFFGFAYAGVAGPSRLDAHVEALVQQFLTPHQRELRAFVRLGGPPAVVSASVILAVSSFLARRPQLALVAAIGPPAAGLVTIALKPVIARTLEGGYALPSGHTAGVTAVATATALLFVSFARSGRIIAIAMLGLLGVSTTGATMSLALVTNDLHFFTDTVAGFCTGLVTVLTTALAVDATTRAPWRST